MKLKYLIATGLALILLFAVAGPVFAQAVGGTQTQPASLNLYSCLSSPLTCAVYGISYFTNEILGLLVSLGGVLIVVGLAIDNAVVQSPAVQQGFGVTLSLANLGFILGIIVIAVATILRSQTYGIKQSLWKLVVMAILVNFGLVITAPIIGFANNLTTYFVQGIGGGTAVTGVGSFGTYTNQFATTLTNAMAPQNLFTQPPSNGSTALNTCNTVGFGAGPIATWACNAIFGNGATDGTTVFFQALFSMIFGVIFSFFAALAMMTLAILLIIRYIYLAMLLILLPLAWLTWIFPMFKGQWSKWWSSFIKWTFFPPLAIFFIWLSLITAGQNVNNNNAANSYLNTTLAGAVPAAGAPGQSAPVTAIMSETGGQGGALQTGIDSLILVGLMLGGLMAASSLSGKAGAVVVNGAKSVSGAVTNYAGQQTKKGARLAWQKAGGEQHTKNLREGNIGALGKVPLVGGVFRRGASLAGRYAETVSTNEELVKEAQKKLPKSWDQAKQNLKGSMNMQDQFASIALGIKEGKIKPDDDVNGKKVIDFLDSNRDAIRRYGQGKLLGDANKLFLSDTNYRNSQRSIAQGQATTTVVDDVKDENGAPIYKTGQDVPSQELLENSGKAIVQNANKNDASKADSNYLFGPKAIKEDIDARLKNIALYNPQLVPGLVKNMTSATFNRFADAYQTKLNSLVKENESQLESLSGSSRDEKERLVTRLKTAQGAFEKGILRSVYGGHGGEEGGHESEPEPEKSGPAPKH